MLLSLEWDWWFYDKYHALSAKPPTIEDLLGSPLTNFTANTCGCSDYFTEIIVTVFHPFFSKAKSEASIKDNPKLHQAMNGSFTDQYWNQYFGIFEFWKEWLPGMQLSMKTS